MGRLYINCSPNLDERFYNGLRCNALIHQFSRSAGLQVRLAKDCRHAVKIRTVSELCLA